MHFFQILQYQYFKLSDLEMKHVLVPQLDPKMEHAIQRKYKSISIRYSKITFAKQITGLNVPQKEVLQVVHVLQDLEFAVFVSFEIQKHFYVKLTLMSFLVAVGCGGLSSENLTYFEVSSADDGPCVAKICKVTNDICQVYFWDQCCQLS